MEWLLLAEDCPGTLQCTAVIMDMILMVIAKSQGRVGIMDSGLGMRLCVSSVSYRFFDWDRYIPFG